MSHRIQSTDDMLVTVEGYAEMCYFQSGISCAGGLGLTSSYPEESYPTDLVVGELHFYVATLNSSCKS